MKATILIIIIFSHLSLGLQAQCLEDGDFAAYCGTETGGCETFNCPDPFTWIRSHGSPQIKIPTPSNHNDNYAYMWFANTSNGPQGEGIFTPFNFRSNNPYKVRVRLQATGDGQIFIYAANNMVQGEHTTVCGHPIPTVNSKQLIAQINETNVGWKEYPTIDFTPSANYSQLWIYPSTTGTRIDLYVDYIFICPDACTGTSYYSTGSITTGETKSANIYIGSSYGGSGTVTVSSTAQTTMSAVNAIIMKDEFRATVTSGTFIARIVACSNPATRLSTTSLNTRPDIDVSKFPRTDSIFAERQNALRSNKEFGVYPNPGRGKIYILSESNTIEIATIKVSDNDGKEVLKKQATISGRSHFALDISSLKPGIYFIQISSKLKTSTQKIVIQ